MMKFLQGLSRLFRSIPKKLDTEHTEIQVTKITHRRTSENISDNFKDQNLTGQKRTPNIPKKEQVINNEPGKESIDKIHKETEAKDIITQKDEFIPSVITKKKEILRIIVGLDFGTSSTKVAFQIVRSHQNLVVPISFDHSLKCYPKYCIPSVAIIEPNGNMKFGIEAAEKLEKSNWDSGIQRIKTLLAGKYNVKFKNTLDDNNFELYVKSFYPHDPIKIDYVTALYLAYVMSTVRKWFKNNSDFRDFDFDLIFNICAPIDHIQQNDVYTAYKRVVAWAEKIEREKSINIKTGVNPNDFIDVFNSNISYGENTFSKFGRTDHNARVFIIPEVIAEIACYLRSSERESGIHGLIDVGNGSTDVSIFNITLSSGLQTSLWKSINIPFGTNEIERIISNRIDAKNNGQCHLFQILSMMNKFSKIEHDKDEKNRKVRIEILNKVRDIWKQSKSAWCSAYKYNPNLENWKKVKLFISGGGSYFSEVQDTFSIPWYQSFMFNYPVNELSNVKNFKQVNGIPFHRMSVAYGLTTPLPELDKFILPNDCVNITPPPLPEIDVSYRNDGTGQVPTNDWLG